MSNTVTLRFSTDDLSVKSVRNVLRRALDKPGDLTELEGTGEVKGVKFSVSTAKPRKPGRPRTAAPKVPTQASLVREWARANSVPVGARGRIHPDVQAAYDAAKVNA